MAVPANLRVAEAAAILTAMTPAEMFTHLTEADGWSFDRVEQWLTDGKPRLLLQVDEQG